MKIIQITQSDTECNGLIVQGLGDDGNLYLWKDAYGPRVTTVTVMERKPGDSYDTQAKDEKGNVITKSVFNPGTTAGWDLIGTSSQMAKPVFHKDDPKRHEFE